MPLNKLIFFLCFTNCVFATNKHSILGVIKSKETGEYVPNAIIKLQHSGNLFVSNSEGKFSIHSHYPIPNDTLKITCLGYEILNVYSGSLTDSVNTIYLSAITFNLKEIYVTNNTPRDLVRRSIEARNKNYMTKPVVLGGYYRSAIKEGEKYAKLTEFPFNICFENYASKAKPFYSKLGSETDTDRRQFKLDEFCDLNQSLSFDHMIYERGFLNQNNLFDWDYEIEGDLKFDNQNVMVINANYKSGSKSKMKHNAKIYMTTPDLVILKVSYQYAWGLPNLLPSKCDSLFINYHTWSGDFHYEKFGGTYYLSNFTMNIGLEVFKNKDLISTHEINNSFFVSKLRKVNPAKLEEIKKSFTEPVIKFKDISVPVANEQYKQISEDLGLKR
jgi:hypothetical protein